MGNLCAPSEADPEKKRNKEVDKYLMKERKKQASEVKILLLGAGESGKSTIFRQMRILHSKGYDVEDRKRFKSVVYGNTLSSIRVLIAAVEQLGYSFENQGNKDIAFKLLEIPQQQIILNAEQVLSRELGNDIARLWKDKGVQSAHEVRHLFQLNDSASYYLDNISRLTEPDYIPTIEDVLRSRVKTVGIVDDEFVYKGEKFKMIDVGGQRSERRKWIHVFDDVTAIIFVTSLSEFNQTLMEKEDVNRIHESLELFEEICNCRYFQKTPIIIFFNKDDLFKEKIQKYDLKCAFPEYAGGCNYENAYKFIEQQFLSKDKSKKRLIFPHPTTATNTENIKTVFQSVKHIFLMDTLDDFLS